MTDYRELESEAQVPDRCPLCLGIICSDGFGCLCNETNGNNKQENGVEDEKEK